MKTKANKPRISLVIPVYNHYDYIKKCVESALRQSYDNYDIVIIDDNSPDKRVVEYLKRISEENTLVTLILSDINQGISKSQNDAVNAAKGDFIAFLDCDDYLPQEALSKVASYLAENPDVKYVFTDRVFVDESNMPLEETHYSDNLEIENTTDHSNNLLVEMMATHLKVVSKKELVKIGGCDLNLTGVQDYDIALKISEHYKLGYIAEPLYFHRIHQASVTNSGNRIPQHVKSGYALRTALERRYDTIENGSTISVRPDFIQDAQTRQLLDWQRKGYEVVATVDNYDDVNTIIPKIGLINTIVCSSDDMQLHDQINKELDLLISAKLLKLTTK